MVQVKDDGYGVDHREGEELEEARGILEVKSVGLVDD